MVEPTIGLDPDQIIGGRDQGGRFGSHPASTGRLETAREQVDPVTGPGELLQAKRKLDLAVGIGAQVPERFAVALLVEFAGDVEPIARMAREGRQGRRQGQGRLDPTILGRRPEQIAQADRRRKSVRMQPALAGRAREPHTRLHSIGQKFTHPDRGRSELELPVVIAHQHQIHRPLAGRRGLQGLESDFLEAALRQPDRCALHPHAAGIDDIDLQRQTRQGTAPVVGPDQDADVETFARPIDATIGEQMRAQLPGNPGIANAADVEARIVELPVVAVERQKRQILATPDLEQQRSLLTGEALQGREPRPPVRITAGTDQALTVATDHLDGRTGDRLAAGDRLHEDIQAAIERPFERDPEIGHHHQPGIAAGRDVAIVPPLAQTGDLVRRDQTLSMHGPSGRLARLLRGLGRIVRVQIEQKYPAPPARPEIVGQIDALLAHLAGRHAGQIDDPLETLAALIRRRAVQTGPLETAVVGRYQMVKLIGQHPRHLQTGTGHIAGDDPDPAIATQAEQRAIGHEAQYRWEIRHPQHPQIGLAQHITAERGQSTLDPYQQVATRICTETEGMLAGVYLLAGQQFEIKRLTRRNRPIGHLPDAPASRAPPLVLRQFRVVDRQQPGPHRRNHLGLADRQRQPDPQHLLGLETVVVDQHRLDRGNLQAESARNLDLGLQTGRGRAATGSRPHPGRQPNADQGSIVGQIEPLGMHEGRAPIAVIADRKITCHRLAVSDQNPMIEPDARLQRDRIDGMTEIDPHDRLLEVRIQRILMELGRPETRRQGRTGELETGLQHPHRRCERARVIEIDPVAFADRPVTGRLEHQQPIAFPGPVAGDLGTQTKPLDTALTGLGQRRHRSIECHPKWMDHDRIACVIGERRRLELETGDRRFRRSRSASPPLPTEADQQNERQHGQSSRQRPARLRTRRSPKRCHPPCHSLRPGRRLPLPTPERQRHQVCTSPPPPRHAATPSVVDPTAQSPHNRI